MYQSVESHVQCTYFVRILIKLGPVWSHAMCDQPCWYSFPPTERARVDSNHPIPMLTLSSGQNMKSCWHHAMDTYCVLEVGCSRVSIPSVIGKIVQDGDREF